MGKSIAGSLAVGILLLSVIPAAARGCDLDSAEFFRKAELPEIESCINSSADINSRNKGGFTPLHHAVFHRPDPELIAQMIEAGAALDSHAEDGSTPLHWAAARNRNPQVITILLEAGAYINSYDKAISTPLHAAAANSVESDIVMALLDAGADPGLVDSSGRTAFDYIKENPYLEGSPAYWRLHDARFD